MKVQVNFDEMRSTELLTLARRAIREFNDRELRQYKVIEK